MWKREEQKRPLLISLPDKAHFSYDGYFSLFSKDIICSIHNSAYCT